MKILAGLLLLGLSTTIVPQDVGRAPPWEACIQVVPMVRYRSYGYDHIVRIQSTCDTDRECWVVTDVNPKPIFTVVPAGEAVEVLTFRGSPSRNFTATVECDARS